jgi:hypothetical protein
VSVELFVDCPSTGAPWTGFGDAEPKRAIIPDTAMKASKANDRDVQSLDISFLFACTLKGAVITNCFSTPFDRRGKLGKEHGIKYERREHLTDKQA